MIKTLVFQPMVTAFLLGMLQGRCLIFLHSGKIIAKNLKKIKPLDGAISRHALCVEGMEALV